MRYFKRLPLVPYFASRRYTPRATATTSTGSTGTITGTAYYIDNGGAGSGTINDPWGLTDLLVAGTPVTQGVALTTLVAGDTLYFRGGDYHVTGEPYGTGNYNSQLISPTVSGTLSQPITLRAYPGETARLIVDGDTDQPLFGTISPDVEYVRFIGFWIEAAEGHTAFNVQGNSIEISYCDIKGKYHAGGDNHESIALTDCFDAWVHHNDIHDLTGDNLNSVGIKLYRGGANLIEDNYIHDCQGAINDKDGGSLGDGVHVTTYRRNWFVDNVEGGFHGSNQGDQATYIVYDNVMNDRFELVLYNDDSQVYNNLFNSPDLSAGGLSVCVTADTNTFRSQLWNNVWFPATSLYFGYNASNSTYVASGPTAQIAYMDYNVYAGTGVPKYEFVNVSHTLAQWRTEGHEINSTFPAAPTDVYVDLIDYVLETAYETAGRYGDPVGPRYPVADIMDVTRYGPAALPAEQGTITLGAMTAAGTATATAGTSSGSAAITLGSMTAAGTIVSTDTGSAGITLGAMTASGTATAALPVATASGAITLAGWIVGGVATASGGEPLPVTTGGYLLSYNGMGCQVDIGGTGYLVSDGT